MSKAGRTQSDAFEGLDPRARIIAAGVALVARTGVQGATTRAIAAAALVQAPTIFRHFGDKNRLLDAIATQTMADFLASKTEAGFTNDPKADLRAGAEAFMAFGVNNPDVFLHIYAKRGKRSPVFDDGYKALQERVRRVALAGELAVSEERACDIVQALARGTVFELFDHPCSEHDGMIRTASQVALEAVTVGSADPADRSLEGGASFLRAHLRDINCLSPGERLLIDELLSRIAGTR